MADDDTTLGGMNGTEAAPPQEQQPEPQPQPSEEQRARDEAGRFAPRGQPDEGHARRREAHERDEARREAQEYRANFEKLQKRFDDMAALAKGEPDKQEPTDPLKPVFDKLEGIDKRLTERDEQQQAAELDQQVRAYADQDELRFRAQQPDLPDAIQHYIRSRVGEMVAFGLTEEQAGAQLQQEATQLLYQSAQSNRSPSQTIYAMAKARGYAGQPGQQPSNVVEMPRAPAPQTNAGGRSFGNGAGAAGGGVSGAALAAMSDDDYMAFRATPEGRRAIKQMMGGAA